MDLTRAVGSSPEIDSSINDLFDYHKWSPEQIAAGAPVVQSLKDCIRVIIEHVPPSPDRTVAIRKIREARMDLNSSITHGGKY